MGKPEEFSFSPIGWIQSPYSTKFGVPRQPGLAPSIVSRVKFKDDFRIQTALKGLEQFSHLWVIFVFHKHGAKDWKPTVRPPRLGGAKKMGVLASRSPHRPNPIGLSVVELVRLDLSAPKGAEIEIQGGDFVDGTPVLDVKPYIAYADVIENSISGWASQPIKKYSVSFTEQALAELKDLFENGHGVRFANDLEGFLKQIEEVLSLDPRPASQKTRDGAEDPKSQGQIYGFELAGVDVQYEIKSDGFLVFSCKILSD